MLLSPSTRLEDLRKSSEIYARTQFPRITGGASRPALREFAAHYHQERNHQGLQDRLIEPAPTGPPDGAIWCRPRLGGLLRHYYRAA